MSLLIGDLVVLPVRIELTTSPLPRECSTTELRQRLARDPRKRRGPAHEERQQKRGDPCHRASNRASARGISRMSVGFQVVR